MEQPIFACSQTTCDEELGRRKFTCPYCGQNFCSKHQDPSNHNCQSSGLPEGLPTATPSEKKVKRIEDISKE